MDSKTYIERLMPLLGGEQNIARQTCREGCFIFTVKDSGAVQLEALCQLDGVAAAELNRGRVRVTAQANFVEDIIMAADNKKIAENVLNAIGGSSNVLNVTHCMTRLRFNLKDETLVDQEGIKKIEGVAGLMISGGQYQVIIGQNVPKVYNELCQIGGFQMQKAVDENLDGDKKEKWTWKSVGNAILNYLSGSLTPLIPIMMAGSMSKTVLTLFGSSMLGLIADGSSLAILFDFMYDASFYFFPVYIGYTSAKKLNTSIPLGMLLGATLLAPDFMALIGAETPFTIFGIPCSVNNYSSSVVPILLSVWVMSFIYRFFENHMPNAISTVFTPFLTYMVMMPIMLCGLAPIGSVLGNYLAVGMEWLGAHCGFLAVAIIGAIYQILVITGMHAPLVVLCITNLVATGSDSLALIATGPATLACSGIALGAMLRLKSKSERGLCVGYLASSLLSGVTEPILYGLCVKYKRPFIALIVGGFCGGLYAGLTHCTYYSLISVVILAPLAYTAGGVANMINGTISMLISFVVAALITYFFGFSKEDLEKDRLSALEGA